MPVFKEVRKRGKFVYFDYRPRYSKIFLHQRDVAWISVTSTKYFPIASHCPPLLHRQLPLLTLPLHSVLPLRISQHCGHHSQETPSAPTSRFPSLRQPAQTAAGGGSRTEEKIGLSSIRRFVKTNLLATCAMNFDEMHPSVVVLFSDTGAVYMNGL